MFRGNWGKLSKAVAGLAAIVAVAIGVGLWIEADSAERYYQVIAEKQAGDYAEAANKESQLECAVARLSSEECQVQAERTARPDQRGEYDLAAQRSMAAWTRAMGKAGVVGVSVGIVGLGLIFVTFRETRRAANSATKTYESFMEAERGRLLVTIPEKPKNVRKGMFLVPIYAENYGRTPVVVVSHAAESQSANIWDDSPVDTSTQVVIQPGKNVEVFRAKAFVYQDVYGHLNGRLRYRTVFGDAVVFFGFKLIENNHLGQETMVGESHKEGVWPEDT